MKILLGGTFSVLHEGHKKMIMEGLKLGELYIGITSDYYPFNKKYEIPPYEFRKREVERFINSMGKKAHISPLNDPFGSTLSPEFDGMIISNETLWFSLKINTIRKSRGIAPLSLYNVGQVLAEDLMPIKSERIIKGEINSEGKRLKELKIAVFTENIEKLKGVENSLKLFIKDFQLESIGIKNEISEPFMNEIRDAAISRIKSSLNYDYFISVEAGVIELFNRSFDIHLAVIKDKYGMESYGISSGLPLNKGIMDELKSGGDLNQVAKKMLNLEGVGKKGGLIYHLSRGVKLRRDLVQEAVVSALTERTSLRLPMVREHVVPLP